jgi:hypothetical protein
MWRVTTSVSARTRGCIANRLFPKGRFLVLLAGDGIREGVPLTELVNHSATKAFTLGLIEVALYQS